MSSNITTDAARQHFVAPLEETPLVAVDAVDDRGQASNLWLDAWRDLRKRPMFWISLRADPAHRRRRAVPRPVHPGAAEQRLLAVATATAARPTATRSASPTRAATSTRASSTARDVARGRPHRDPHRRPARHHHRRLRRLLRRLARLAALARRRHLLRDPLHPRGRRHHVGVLAVPRTCG